MPFQQKFYTSKGCWIIAVLVFILPLLLIILISQFTPILMVWGIRGLIGSATYGEPDNIEEINRNVRVVLDIEYGEDHHNLLDIYYPSNIETLLPVVVYIHGGGFIGGDKSLLETFAMSIAHEGYVVANINYGLAPEQPYPHAITHINQALEYLSENIITYGGDIDNLFIAGNSAGAHLTSQMAAVITNERLANQIDLQPVLSEEQLQGVILINGIYNMQTLRSTEFPGIELFLWSYTGKRQFENYERIDEISSIQHITRQYPPTFITVGDIDPLESQSLELIDVLERNFVDVTPILFTGTQANLNHDFILSLDHPHSQNTFHRMIDFLQQHRN